MLYPLSYGRISYFKHFVEGLVKDGIPRSLILFMMEQFLPTQAVPQPVDRLIDRRSQSHGLRPLDISAFALATHFGFHRRTSWSPSTRGAEYLHRFVS